jgi:hypothetical protein
MVALFWMHYQQTLKRLHLAGSSAEMDVLPMTVHVAADSQALIRFWRSQHLSSTAANLMC